MPPPELLHESMHYRISFDPDLSCVVTKITGEMSRPQGEEFFAEAGRIASEHNCSRMLTDVRGAKFAGSTTDIYEVARKLEEMQVRRSFRRAIVISGDHDDYRFWETVCYNHGHQHVKLFENLEDAKRWVAEA